jgi:DNA-binding XRE family transcriptional regulator
MIDTFVTDTKIETFLMRERLEELMQLLNLNPTQFANAIGVQRATLQHILSGRNEPSLKIIMAIHSSFPDVELEWLLNGKGSAIPQLQQNEQPRDDYPLLPGMENMFFQEDVRNSPEFSNVRGDEPQPKQRKRRNNKEVEPIQEGNSPCIDKRIKEVVVFFADGTYQKFSSDLKK